MNRLEWRRETDSWYVRSYIQSLRRVPNALRFQAEHGFHPLYAADKLEKMVDALDERDGHGTLERYRDQLRADEARLQAECARLREQLAAADTRYELTDAGREALEGGK